jgi:putative aldouronate transport system substrate-binding protein
MWIDKIYEPLQSTQNNWGTYGDENQQNIFELTKEGTFLQHLPLGNMSPWELRQKTFVGGPLAILDTYYDKYITKPDDAAWRLNVIKDVYVPQMKMDNNFPKVFYSIEDQETLTNIEVHMFEFATTKVAEWIQNGKIDDEWDSYLNDLKTMGLDEWLTIKQTYYDKVTQ